MSWVIFALLGAFFWSLVHHLDKVLLTKFSKNYGIGALVIFSSIFPALALPILFIFATTNPFFLSIGPISLLIGAGILGAVAALLYFHALEDEETTIVVSMYQLSPVFGFVLGVVFLSEFLGNLQILGAVVTILGVSILSLEFFEEKRVTFRKKTTLLMTVAAFVFALGDVIYKWAAGGADGYFPAMFWIFVGYVVFGIAVFFCVRSYREDFLLVFKNRKRTVLGLNLLNECFQTAGVMFTGYALLLGPVALVLVMDAYQPVLVFVIGIILTLSFPTVASEKLSLRHLIHKSTAILIALIGTILMQSP
jgi:drug/metabolite transporter (DMT)-like permease